MDGSVANTRQRYLKCEKLTPRRQTEVPASFCPTKATSPRQTNKWASGWKGSRDQTEQLAWSVDWFYISTFSETPLLPKKTSQLHIQRTALLRRVQWEYKRLAIVNSHKQQWFRSRLYLYHFLFLPSYVQFVTAMNLRWAGRDCSTITRLEMYQKLPYFKVGTNLNFEL